VRESAEDWFPADPVLGEVDHLRPGAGLSGCELAGGAVRPGDVVVPQVFGQYSAQVMLIDDLQPVGELPAQGADDPFVDGVRPRACGGLARILMLSAVNTASKEPLNCPARSLIKNLTEAERWPRSIRKLRAAWVVHAPSGFAVMPAR